MKKVPLSRGEFALVDDCDFELVSQHTWQCHVDPKSGRKYAVCHIWVGGERKTMQMHRLILWHASEHTDHKDGNGLNNQRCNIRPATRIENGQNRKLQDHSAPFKGVHLLKANNSWTAYIRVNRVKKHLGTFKTAREAAHAYDSAAILHFGQFARTNQQIGAL